MSGLSDPCYRHSVTSLSSITDTKFCHVRRTLEVFPHDRLEPTSPMAMDDAQVRSAAESSPIQRREDLLECFVCSLASYVYHSLFIQPQSIIR